MTGTECTPPTIQPGALSLVRPIARAVLPALLAIRLSPNPITFTRLAPGLGACLFDLRASTP